MVINLFLWDWQDYAYSTFETHSRIIHTYTRNAEETALYIARTTRALAEHRWRDPPTILSLTKKQKLTGEIEKNSGPMEWFIKMILHIDSKWKSIIEFDV